MKSQVSIDRDNNFDLLRLFAAIQVMLYHGIEHFDLSVDSWAWEHIAIFLNYFHGVPIFFAVSGFLIMMSYERTSSIKKYFKNRLLRLYPALWVSFLITFIALIYFGHLNAQNILSKQSLVWVLGQLSVFQFFTPDILRDYGLGNPNGNLWTIAVELQFYIFVPIFSILPMKKTLLGLASLGAILVNYYFFGLKETMIGKMVFVTILPYLFYFGFGMFLYMYFGVIKKYLENNAFKWLFLYVTYIMIVSYSLNLYTPSYSPNGFALVGDALLVVTMFSFVFSYKQLSKKVLKGNDISYGLYIYHAIVLNVFFELGFNNGVIAFSLFSIISLLLGYLSWQLVEKKALAFK